MLNATFNNNSGISWRSILLVWIRTDCTGSYKSKYHAITTQPPPPFSGFRETTVKYLDSKTRYILKIIFTCIHIILISSKTITFYCILLTQWCCVLRGEIVNTHFTVLVWPDRGSNPRYTTLETLHHQCGSEKEFVHIKTSEERSGCEYEKP